jgi:L-glyceraldehyde 3-phosphate reductase
LAQGLLTDKYLNGIPDDSRAAKKNTSLKGNLTEENINKVRELKKIADRRGQSIAQMALAWDLRKVTSVIIGASRVSQIEENVRALDNLEFSDDELKEIDEILSK